MNDGTDLYWEINPSYRINKGRKRLDDRKRVRLLLHFGTTDHNLLQYHNVLRYNGFVSRIENGRIVYYQLVDVSVDIKGAGKYKGAELTPIPAPGPYTKNEYPIVEYRPYDGRIISYNQMVNVIINGRQRISSFASSKWNELVSSNFDPNMVGELFKIDINGIQINELDGDDMDMTLDLYHALFNSSEIVPLPISVHKTVHEIVPVVKGWKAGDKGQNVLYEYD